MDEGVALTLTFGELLKHLRAAAGLTQEELAEQACISSRSISNMERSRIHRPRQDTLRLVATALHLSPEDYTAFMAAARLSTPSPGARVVAPLVARALEEAAFNLPLPPTPLIGRERQVAAGSGMLRRMEVRLLTLCGPPGVGKTRLALQIAAEVLADFSDGVFFVSLTPLRDPTLVALFIAQALGLREADVQSPLDILLAHLRDRRLLLLLDNFEHLIAAAPLMADLLAVSPGLTLLVTSRTALHLRGEQELPVLPLTLPDRSPRSTRSARGGVVEALMQVASVALFVQRAQAIVPEFILTPKNASAVA